MTIRLAGYVGILLGLAGVAIAVAPVATMTSSSRFELSGKQVNADGVPSWPVMEGDEIATSTGPATIQFRDGSRVTLDEKSRAKVEKTAEGLIFRLLTGAMQFTLAPQRAVAFYSGTKLVPAQEGVATVASTVSTNPGAKFGTQRILPPPPPPASGR